MERACDRPAHFKTAVAGVRQPFPITVSAVTTSTHLTNAVLPLTVRHLNQFQVLLTLHIKSLFLLIPKQFWVILKTPLFNQLFQPPLSQTSAFILKLHRMFTVLRLLFQREKI